jgi:hypothetical protein
VFIRQLQRPMREKIVLGILMGCGLLATAAGITRMVFIKEMAYNIDLFYQGVYIGIFTYVQQPSLSVLSD